MQEIKLSDLKYMHREDIIELLILQQVRYQKYLSEKHDKLMDYETEQIRLKYINEMKLLEDENKRLTKILGAKKEHITVEYLYRRIEFLKKKISALESYKYNIRERFRTFASSFGSIFHETRGVVVQVESESKRYRTGDRIFLYNYYTRPDIKDEFVKAINGKK